MTSRKILTLLAALAIVTLVQGADIYNYKKSYITPLTQLNFKNQVSKIRETTNMVSIVHFYKENDGKSRNFASEFDEFTNEYRGAFRIGAVNCDADTIVCELEKI
jgi:thioredoxin-like negative regulator of GroEL